MHNQGDAVGYKCKGVYRIEDVGTLDFTFADRKKKYYTLQSVGNAKDRAYVPIDDETNIRKPIEEMSFDEWNTMMRINTGTVFLGCKTAIPVMRHQGGGAIINTSSVCGLIGHRYTPEAYTATKGAVTMLTKAVASRYAKDGIRCNCINPSTVDTPFVQELFKDPERKKERLGEVPLGRLATVDDVANAVLYLASEEAAFINGVALPIDGGVTCY